MERPDTPRSPEHWILLALSLLSVAFVVTVGAYLEPDARGYGTHEQLGLKPCYPLATRNVPCPGCGVTTSVAHLARGDVLASLAAQPLGTLLGFGSLLFAMGCLRGHVRRRDLWLELNRASVAPWIGAAVAVVLLCWLYKTAAVRGWL